MPRSQRRPITAEDLAAIAIVDRPRLAPDGETVAFALAKPDLEARANQSALWAVSYAGGELRQLTSGVGRDRAPTWSPDGRWIAFLSDREGGRGQLWALPTAAGEARRLTENLKGIDGVVWSPASDQLALVAGVRPAGEASIVNDPAPPVAREIRRIKHRFDGRGLLDGRTHIFVVGLNGGEPRQITD